MYGINLKQIEWKKNAIELKSKVWLCCAYKSITQADGIR